MSQQKIDLALTAYRNHYGMNKEAGFWKAAPGVAKAFGGGFAQRVGDSVRRLPGFFKTMFGGVAGVPKRNAAGQLVMDGNPLRAVREGLGNVRKFDQTSGGIMGMGKTPGGVSMADAMPHLHRMTSATQDVIAIPPRPAAGANPAVDSIKNRFHDFAEMMPWNSSSKARWADFQRARTVEFGKSLNEAQRAYADDLQRQVAGGQLPHDEATELLARRIYGKGIQQRVSPNAPEGTLSEWDTIYNRWGRSYDPNKHGEYVARTIGRKIANPMAAVAVGGGGVALPYTLANTAGVAQSLPGAKKRMEAGALEGAANMHAMYSALPLLQRMQMAYDPNALARYLYANDRNGAGMTHYYTHGRGVDQSINIPGSGFGGALNTLINPFGAGDFLTPNIQRYALDAMRKNAYENYGMTKEAFVGKIVPWAAQGFQRFMNFLRPVADDAASAVGKAAPAAGEVAENAGNAARQFNAGKFLRNTRDRLNIVDSPEAIKDNLSHMWGGIKAPFSVTHKGVVGGIRGVAEATMGKDNPLRRYALNYANALEKNPMLVGGSTLSLGGLAYSPIGAYQMAKKKQHEIGQNIGASEYAHNFSQQPIWNRFGAAMIPGMAARMINNQMPGFDTAYSQQLAQLNLLRAQQARAVQLANMQHS